MLLLDNTKNSPEFGDFNSMDKSKDNNTTTSKDEVDFSPPKTTTIPLSTTKKGTFGDIDTPSQTTPKTSLSSPVKCSLSTLEKLNLFQFSPLRNKKLNSAIATPASVTTKEKPKFVKSASIARIFGNTYSTKKCNQPSNGNTGGGGGVGGTGVTLISSAPKHFDRFRKTQGDKNTESDEFQIRDISESPERDISTKAMRSLSRGLGRLLRRRSSSIDISEPDPEFKVAYLGNVLTGWAKGT